MAEIVLSAPLFSEIIFYQFLLSGMGFLGSIVAYSMMRTVRDDEWRETGMRFAKALALFASLEFAELTKQFWSYDILAVVVEITLISYIVYGVMKMRFLLEDSSDN